MKKTSARRTSARKARPKGQEFNVVIERDEDGWYVASVPGLRGCHTQARSLDALMERVKEAIALCLEEADASPRSQFIGLQRVAV